MRTGIFMAIGLTSMLLAACGQAPSDAGTGPASSSPLFVLNGDVERGAVVYSQQCAACHGSEGRGDGPAGRALRPNPTDFVEKEFSAEHAYLVTKGGGMAGGLAPTMPPFERAMSDDDIRNVVAYIVSLKGE